MSYSIIAHDVVFNNSWETYPYSSGIRKVDQLHFYINPERERIDEDAISWTYVKMNVRAQLEMLHPEEQPLNDTIGSAIKKALSNLGIEKYISAENTNWGWGHYYWHPGVYPIRTLEAVFIPEKDYKNKILIKIEEVARQSILPKTCEKNISSSNKRLEQKPIEEHYELECPITYKIMQDPVIGTDGHTYERDAIETWLKKTPRSPISGEVMLLDDLRPNLLIRKIIDILNRGENL